MSPAYRLNESLQAVVPDVVAEPARSRSSFTVNGTPWRLPTFSFFAGISSVFLLQALLIMLLHT